MSAEPMASVVDLPHGRILSYVTVANSPTRVRRIASAGLRVLGAAILAASIGWGILLGLRVYVQMMYVAGMAIAGPGMGPGGPPAPSLWWMMTRHAGALATPLGLVILFGTPGALLLLSAGGVRDGNKMACSVATVCLVTVWCASLLGAALWGAAVLLAGTTMVRGIVDHEIFWWLSLEAVFIPVILLQSDLIGFIRWIARNPVAEKPPVPFLQRDLSVIQLPPALPDGQDLL